MTDNNNPEQGKDYPDEPPPPYPGPQSTEEQGAPPPYMPTPAANAQWQVPPAYVHPTTTQAVHLEQVPVLVPLTTGTLCPNCGVGVMQSQPDVALIMCLIILAFMFTPFTLCCIPCAFRMQCTQCSYRAV